MPVFARCFLVVYVTAFLWGQSTAKRIFVADLGDKPAMQEVRNFLAADLRKSKVFTLAGSQADADAVLSGHGDLWVKGYYSLNPRAGTAPANGEPIYGGYISVELKDRSGDTLWSYLATPHYGSHNMARDLAKDVVKHLLESPLGQEGH
ncbi:MAG TPA: hypothetical protein VMB25_05060 [Bryobacteraceae bacterium]|nr:hypothetical protein [Bryobacteraceae bacterium]